MFALPDDATGGLRGMQEAIEQVEAIKQLEPRSQWWRRIAAEHSGARAHGAKRFEHSSRRVVRTFLAPSGLEWLQSETNLDGPPETSHDKELVG